MSEPLLGQILTFGGTFAPQGYMACNGQSLPISQNDALYNLIGTTYGGDGVTTFNLPDLQGRTPVHQGSAPNLSTYTIGQQTGSESVTLITPQLPQHTHTVGVVTGSASDSDVPNSNAVLGDMGPGNVAATTYVPFDASGQIALAPQSVTSMGNSAAHENRQPYLVITYAIAVAGIYPQQN